VRILTDTWRDGFQDYALQDTECRVKVEVWCTVVPIRDLYFVRRPDAATLANYIREIGPREALRKWCSRRKEKSRNEKFLSFGAGEVAEVGARAAIPAKTRVVFIAPSHPRCVERVVLPGLLVKPMEDETLLRRLPAVNGVVFIDQRDRLADVGFEDWKPLAGWSPYSGEGPSPEVARGALRTAERRLAELLGTSGVRPCVLNSVPSGHGERTRLAPERTGKERAAVLFGFGNYAKSIILPNLPPTIRLVKVHEIDPVQLEQASSLGVALDTASLPQKDEAFDVYLIAGFHHTHAPISLRALEQGAAAVVEKPAATSEAQLEALSRAMRATSGRLFVGFQRRYWRFNAMATSDLGVGPGDPVSYTCEVHEEPLPERHWYRWPVSRGRIVANGCHWIDHFLFLNHFAEVEYSKAGRRADSEVVVDLRLANGATFRMRLTDRATARTGMRNTIELQARDGIVRIENDLLYRAERSGRGIRKIRANRLAAYREMYAAIFRRIVQNGPGDSAAEVIDSAGVSLALQDELDDA
jgi:predicted dehydrogenase